MTKLRQILNSDLTSLILRWRYGPFVLVAGWIALHGMLGYELFTGKMRLRWEFEWIEGRQSSPVLYWIYIAGSAGVLVLIDAYFFWSVLRDRRKKAPIQAVQRTPGNVSSDAAEPAARRL